MVVLLIVNMRPFIGDSRYGRPLCFVGMVATSLVVDGAERKGFCFLQRGGFFWRALLLWSGMELNFRDG